MTDKKPPEFSPDDPVHPELVKMAHEWVLGASPTADQNAHTVFTTLLVRLLQKAWRLGHKWDADSDPNLREKVRKWLSVPEDPSRVEESLFDLVKEVEDQAWMRLSTARTRHINQLEELLGVKGGSEIVEAVRKLVEPSRGDIINRRASSGARCVTLRERIQHAKPDQREVFEKELQAEEAEYARLKEVEEAYGSTD